MLVSLDANNVISGVLFNGDNVDWETTQLEANPTLTYIKGPFEFVEDIALYQYLNGIISLISDWETKKVELEAEKLAIELPQKKEQKRIEAKQKREGNISAVLNNFDVATLQDRENIQGSITYFNTLSQGQDFIVWHMADNTQYNATLTDLQGVLDAFVLRKAQEFIAYQSILVQIELCTTLQEVEVIVI